MTQLLEEHLQAIRQRFGSRQLETRLGEQRYPLAGDCRQGTPFDTIKHLINMDDVIRFGLKASGMWSTAYRNYLDIVVEKHEVKLERLPASFNGFRILHLTDLHIDLDERLAPRVAEVVQDLEYDAAVITGDFRNQSNGGYKRSMELMQAVIDALKPPIFGSLGNHDFIEKVPDLERQGVRMLLNENEPLYREGARIWMAGVDDSAYYSTADVAQAADKIPATDISVLLAHCPNLYKKAHKHHFDLMLSGHTHGGQICLPGGIAILGRSDCPSWALKGPWRYKALRGYTSRGTGSCKVPARLFCPPEVTLHILRKG